MRKSRLSLCLPFLLFVVILTLNSCLGLSMDIQMRPDGSGRITAEYRISRMIETLGKLDGNENWPVIPAGRADLERTIARIPGLRLISYSSNTNERTQDTVINSVMEYSNPQALLNFLDPSGGKVSFHENPNRLNIIINNEQASLNADNNQIELVRHVFTGYNFSMSFSAAGNAEMTVTDGTGHAISPPPSIEIISSGRRVSLSAGMFDVVNITGGLGVIFSW